MRMCRSPYEFKDDYSQNMSIKWLAVRCKTKAKRIGFLGLAEEVSA